MIDLPPDQENIVDQNIILNEHKPSLDPLQMAMQLNEELQNSCKICLNFLNRRKKKNFEKRKQYQKTLDCLFHLEKLKENNFIGWFGIPYFKDHIPSSEKQVFGVPGRKSNSL